MPLELITAGTHGSQVALYRKSGRGSCFYQKVSFSRAANQVIANEKQGHDWFNRQPGKTAAVLRKDYYYELDIPAYRGRNFSPSATMAGHEADIHRIVDAYIQKWTTAREHYHHGDLALCNAVIDADRVYLVDWEHCHKTTFAYFGFDICNLLFVSLYAKFNPGEIVALRPQHIACMRACFEKLRRHASGENRILDRPFCRAANYLRDHSQRFGLNIPVGQKFLLAAYPLHKLEAIDRRIGGD